MSDKCGCQEEKTAFPGSKEKEVGEIISSAVRRCFNEIKNKTINKGERNPKGFHCSDPKIRFLIISAVIAHCEGLILEIEQGNMSSLIAQVKDK